MSGSSRIGRSAPSHLQSSCWQGWDSVPSSTPWARRPEAARRAASDWILILWRGPPRLPPPFHSAVDGHCLVRPAPRRGAVLLDIGLDCHHHVAASSSPGEARRSTRLPLQLHSAVDGYYFARPALVGGVVPLDRGPGQ
jgi:hypothetical protein